MRDVSGETSEFNVQAFSTGVVPVQPEKVRRKRGRPFKRKRGQTGVAVAGPGDARFSAALTDPLPATAAAHTPPKRRRRKNDTVKDPFDLVKSEPDSVGVQHSLSVMDMITNTTGDTSNTVQASLIDTTVQSGKARRKPGRPFKRKYKRMSQPLADTDASAEYPGACGLIKPETDSVHFVHAAEDMADKSAETSENVQAFSTDVPVKARRKRGRPFGTTKRRPPGTVQDPLNARLSAVNTDALLGTDADHRISQRKKRQAKVVTDPGNVWFSEGSIDPLSESKMDALPAPDAVQKPSIRRKRQPKTVKDHNNACLSAGSTDPLSESMIDALPMTNAVQKPPKRKKRQAKTVTDLVNACLSAVPDSMDPFPETNADHKPPRKRKKRQSKTAQHIDTFCFSAGGIDSLPESIIDPLPAPDAHPNTGVEGVGPAPPQGVGPAPPQGVGPAPPQGVGPAPLEGVGLAPPEKRRPGRPRKRPLVVSQEQDAAVAVEDRIDQVRDLLGEGEHHLRTLRRRGDGAVSHMKNEVGLLPTVRRRRRKPSVQQVPADMSGCGVNEAAASMLSGDMGFGGDEEGAPVQPRARKRRRRKIRWGKKRRTDAKVARPRQRVARMGQHRGADLESRSPSATDTAPSPSPCLSSGSSEPFRTVEMLSHVKSEDVEMELDYFNSLPPSRRSLKSKANVTVKAEQSVPTVITTERSKPGWGGLRTRRKRKAKWGRRKRRVNPLPSALEAGEPLARLKQELDGFEDVQPGIDGVDHFNGMASRRGGQQYKCPDCGLICRFLSQYLIHSRIHTGEKPYNCHECGKGFNRNSNLTLHLRTHKRSRVYQRCPICKINMSCSEFSAHLKKHGEEIVIPDYEKRKFIRRRRRKRDLDGEFEAEIICKYCGKQFPFPSALERHVRVHTGEKPFKCDICGKGFGQAYFLRVHELSHWSVKRYNCTLCQKSFSHISSAKKHSCLRECRGRRLMTSLSYTCHICKETFYTVEDFNSHMRSHTGAKLYRCLFCDKLFGVLSEFNDHRNHCNVAGREGSSMSYMADHEETKISREYLLPEPIRTRGSRQGISFLITDEADQKRADEREPVRRTDKPFLSTAASSQPPSLLASKLNDLDNRSDPRKYFCPSCGRMFRHMGRLRAHMLSHGRGQTFTCECCGKTLESWKKLWRHQRLHRQRQGRFTCPRCGRGFRFVGAYRRHMTEHPEVRWVRTRPSRAAPLPYQCEECSGSFRTLGELFGHQLCHSPSQSAQEDSDFHLSIEHRRHGAAAAASNSAPKTLNPHMNGYSSACLPEPHHQHRHHHAGFQHGGANPNPEPHHQHHHHPGFQHGGANPNPEPHHQHRHHHAGFQHGGANPNPEPHHQHRHHHAGFQHGGANPNPEPHHQHHHHHAGFQHGGANPEPHHQHHHHPGFQHGGANPEPHHQHHHHAGFQHGGANPNPEPHHHHAGFQHGGANPNPNPEPHHQHHHPGFQHGGANPNPNPEPHHQHHHHAGFQHGGANPEPHHHHQHHHQHHHHPGFQHGGANPNPEPHHQHHHHHHAGFQPSPPSLITGPHYNPYYSRQHPKPVPQQQFPTVSVVAPPPHLLLHPSQYRIVPQPRSTPLSVAAHEGRGVSWTQNAHVATSSSSSSSSSSLTVHKPHYSRLCVKPRQHEMSPDGIKCAVCGRPFTDVSRLYQHYLQHARGQC